MFSPLFAVKHVGKDTILKNNLIKNLSTFLEVDQKCKRKIQKIFSKCLNWMRNMQEKITFLVSNFTKYSSIYQDRPNK